MSDNTAEKIESEIQVDETIEQTKEQPISLNKEEVEVEVVDDTPLEDRNRPKRTEGTQPDIPDDDEINSYKGDVQKRIKQLKFEYHEERRQKEEAKRTSDEAVAHAQRLVEENKKLRKTLDDGESVLVSSSSSNFSCSSLDSVSSIRFLMLLSLLSCCLLLKLPLFSNALFNCTFLRLDNRPVKRSTDFCFRLISRGLIRSFSSSASFIPAALYILAWGLARCKAASILAFSSGDAFIGPVIFNTLAFSGPPSPKTAGVGSVTIPPVLNAGIILVKTFTSSRLIGINLFPDLFSFFIKISNLENAFEKIFPVG